jgi:hypothetical protein
MANLIPPLGAARFDSSGERRLAERLRAPRATSGRRWRSCTPSIDSATGSWPCSGRREIPLDVVKLNHNRISIERPAVRLMTMHTAKGLEFPCVAVAALGELGARRDTPLEDDIRLAYVAITRATHEAFLTYSRSSPLVQRITGAIA